MTVDGSKAASNFETIIDSGSTIITAPTSAAKKFWAKVSGSKVYDADQGLYQYPCDSPPDVAFSWGGKSWSISADECVSSVFFLTKQGNPSADLAGSTSINLGTVSSGSSQCVGSIAGGDLGLGSSVWLLGDT